MSVRRAAALTAVLCAIAIGSLALPWFRADLNERRVDVPALQVSPVLWLIVPIAITIVALVLRAARAGALTGSTAWRSLTAAALAGGVGCVVALCATLLPSIVVRAADVTNAPDVPVDRLPAGFVAAGAFAGVTALVCSWLIGVANAIDDGL